MQLQHYGLLAGFLAALAAQISGLDHWEDVLHPGFVAGVLGQLAVLIGALAAKPVGSGNGPAKNIS